MDDLFKVCFSPEGSNKKTVELSIVAFWRDFLLDVEEKETSATMEGILIFATGADCIPPCGFFPEPSIEFLHHYGAAHPGLLPVSNTCRNCLKLPIYPTYKELKTIMDFAFCNTQGFGKE
ncbi:G2/M phase-specific E3 ubiquitin-protein ligase-like [Polypterus senegalus]|uniref:G2/M phase-specific E3 ubiquitin-protein ligase-like n=1 Tax=Polypterus senegalus TaxID=55291 RepID=UPI001965CABE|nr:G2/M phase-specific E3 ubiquitin-protein ligase-like [Polypterus senegalus]